MNESGINSVEEFALFYLFVAFVIGALWVILEADVVLGSVHELAARREKRLRVSRVLAPLGALHIGFALIAWDAARRDPEAPPHPDNERRRRRAALEARVCLGAGLLVAAAVGVGL